MATQDWFADNAPKAAGGNWFAANAPKAVEPDFTSNPKNEGLYTMRGMKGDINVPYSKVPTAQATGMSLLNESAPRYQKDSAAEGKAPGIGGVISEALQPTPSNPLEVGLSANTFKAAGR